MVLSESHRGCRHRRYDGSNLIDCDNVPVSEDDRFQMNMSMKDAGDRHVLREIEDGELDVNTSKSHASFFPKLMLIIHNECHEHAAVC